MAAASGRSFVYNIIMELKGQVVLITGAAAGIGLSYSEELLKNGAKVSTLWWTHLFIIAKSLRLKYKTLVMIIGYILVTNGTVPVKIF